MRNNYELTGNNFQEMLSEKKQSAKKMYTEYNLPLMKEKQEYT